MSYTLEIVDHQILTGGDIYSHLLDQYFRDSLYLHDELHLSANGRELQLLDSYGKRLWEQPILCPAIARKAWQSGNRVLVATNTEEYHAWGYLGPALIIDLDNGKIIKEIKGSHGTPLSNGQFIVGLEGYDTFDSWLYDREGELLQNWRSCGHFVVNSQEDIFVIEQDRNSPTRAHVVRLHRDGTIEKGMKLRTAGASSPILLGNDDFVFENSGFLRVIDSNLQEVASKRLLEIKKEDSWRFIGIIELIGANHLLVHILERSDGDTPPIAHATHQWLLKIRNTKLDRGDLIRSDWTGNG